MEDIKDIQSIRLFVDEFYSMVRRDGLLGPVFEKAIKDSWPAHLEKMYAFWHAALFGMAGFKGNPFAKHAPLPIEQRHFERWLKLFNMTIDRHFEGAVANDAKNRAELMAEMFLSRLGMMNGNVKKIIV